MRIEFFTGYVFTLIYRSDDYFVVIYSGFDEDVARDVDRAVGIFDRPVDIDEEGRFELTTWDHGLQTRHEYFDGEKWCPVSDFDEEDEDDDEFDLF